jgi:hypothetical protein
LKKSKAILDYNLNNLYLKLWFYWFYENFSRFFNEDIERRKKKP